MTDAFDRLKKRSRTPIAREGSLTTGTEPSGRPLQLLPREFETFCDRYAVDAGDVIEAALDLVLLDPDLQQRLLQRLRQGNASDRVWLGTACPRSWQQQLQQQAQDQGLSEADLLQEAIAQRLDLVLGQTTLREEVTLLRQELEQLKRKLHGW